MPTRQDNELNNACSKGRLRRVREILEKGGDVVSMLETRLGFLGYTPMHEAACQGYDDILRLLLIYGGDVNARANGNYTPLHIAASMNYVKCIEVLLKNNANIRALDDFNKTPYQTALQHKRKECAKCLKSAEIIRAAKENPQELRNVLNETHSKDITKKCFNEALIEASHVGNFESVAMLLVAKASNIRDCIGISIRKGHYKVTVLLLICYAATTEDINLLETLLDNSLNCIGYLKEFLEKSLPAETVAGQIRTSLKNNKEDCTNVAIRLCGDLKATKILKVLLLNTSCHRDFRKVNWSRLLLEKLHNSCIDPIKSWVQSLNLSSNKLTSLPENFIELKFVSRLNLSANKLKVIPSHVFSLICLRELNISSNAISELPEDLELKPTLKSLNVGDNNLNDLPVSISQSRLETLNLSKNNFVRIPLCVCEIISLKDLDLSNNREISELPNEMGKLRNLISLHLRNLDQITDPPEKVRQNAEDLVSTLRTKLRSSEAYFTMKLMLVGKGSQGKTTLVRRLQDNFAYKDNDLTQGVEISDLSIRKGFIKNSLFHKEFCFKVWDFGGQEDYYATHQCFLSTMSLYLLVWRLIDGEEGVNGLTPWLDNIAVRSPGSTVIIVGTHLDGIDPEKHGVKYVEHLKSMVYELVSKPRYGKVLVSREGIHAVSCAFGNPRSRADISTLRQFIYDTAANLKKGRSLVMGELVPSSFLNLIARIETRKLEMLCKKQPPIMRKEEFHAMVKENARQCKKDIEDPLDVRDATVFLRERGIVMHFDDPNEGLNDLYFIDPRWLSTLMARVVTVKNHADLVKDGILEIQKTSVLFRADDLPYEFLSQYIRLLVRFQVAYLLDESRILVPSKLPEEIPEDVEKLLLRFAPVRRVYKIDYQSFHGFWSRFMSRFFFYMKEMIAVEPSRYKKSEESEHGFSAKFCRSCVGLETGCTNFPCFFDLTESSEKDEPGGAEAKKPEDSAAPAEEKPAAAPPPAVGGSRSVNERGSVKPHWTASGYEGDNLQALFLDPTVKLFDAEELEGHSDDDDDVDGIVINNVDTAMITKFRSPSVLKRRKSAKHRPTTSARASSRKSDHKTSQKSTSSKIKDENPHRAEGENHPTSNGDYPRTDEIDPAGGEIPLTKTPGHVSIDRAPDGHDQNRELNGENENIAEDVLTEESPSHKSLPTPSTSLESEQNDAQFSGGEQPKHSSVSSRTPSECSSSLTSATDNFLESDLFSESGSTNLGRNPDTMSASVSTTESVTSEDYWDCGGGLYVRSQSGGDNCAVSSPPTNPQTYEKSQIISSCEGEEENEGSIGIAILGDTADETSVGATDVTDAELKKPPSNAGCDVMHDTTGVDDVTKPTGPIHTNSEVTEVFDTDSDVANVDVAGSKLDVFEANPDSKLVTDSDTDVTGSKLDVFDANPDSKLVTDTQLFTDTQCELAGTDSEVVEVISETGQESVAEQPSFPHDTRDGASPMNINEDHSSDSTSAEHSKMSNCDDVEDTQASDVQMEKCTLCKENVLADELVIIPLDVADLIRMGYLQCWRSGVCLMHPDVFLLVSHRSLPDTFIVECAVSPSFLGRRLLTFVVDHVDTLFKEWYPGLLNSCGAVQKIIPCRVCEKNGVAKPHRFTFDSCVTQYSMGNFVKCPQHEVAIHDIAPDVVLQDLDPELVLREEEIEYEATDANKIGDGAFGNVYRGRCRGKDAAIKEYSTPNGDEAAMKRYCEVRKELNVLRRVGLHPFLVNFIGVCLRPFRLVLELAVEGSLGKTLFNPEFHIDRVVVYRMVYQVAEALSFLHSLNVIYRDLKPGNVLVMSYDEEDDVNIKLTDFGTATFQFAEGLLALEGTPGYHAPEMLKEFCERSGYNERVDVFSLAMLIYGFVTRRRPFYNINSSADINDMVSNGRKPDYDNVVASRIGLVTLTWLMEKCLQYDPSTRPSASVVATQVRSTPFQICLGLLALPCPQSVRHVCVVEATRELWVAVDDKATNTVLVYELNGMCLKKKFTINRMGPDEPPLCMQINCMHVTSSSVLIGLRGDLDVVTVHDLQTYGLKVNISLPEPVFCMSSNEDYIFLGMSSGVFRVVPRTNSEQPQTREVSHSEPITCMVAVDNYLWLSVGKSIQIFHTVEAESIQAFELNAVRFSPSNCPISHAVLSVDRSAVWCVSTGDAVVTGWHVAKRQMFCEFHCKSLLDRVWREERPLEALDASVTCIVAALDTVWLGTGGGVVLVLDARSGELITWVRLFDDHVRTLTLVSGPGPSTERAYVVVSGKNLQDTALTRGGKALCRLGQEVIREAPMVQTPAKEVDKTKGKAKKGAHRAKSPGSERQKTDFEDGGVSSSTNRGLLLFFEVLPADVLRRIEAGS